MGRPLQARAANGDYVQLGSGYTATYQTKIRNASTARGDGPDNRTLWLESVNGGALLARGHYGVSGQETFSGVDGYASQTDGVGVTGAVGPGVPIENPLGAGVYGLTSRDLAAIGVRGRSPLGTGVQGEATSGIGVYGTSDSQKGVSGYSLSGIGVGGETAGEDSSSGSLRTGVLGRATGVGTYGVYGVHDFAVGFGVYGKNEENGNYGYIGGRAAV